MRTLKEAAEVMGIAPRSIYARIVRGRMPEAIKVKGRWMIPDEVTSKYEGTIRVTKAYKWLRRQNGPRVAKQTMYNCILDGRLPAIQDHLGMYRVRLSDVKELYGYTPRKRE